MARLDLFKIRRKHKLTQQQLSNLIGYPQGYISRIERGKSDASKMFIARVQEALNIEDIGKYLVKDEPEIEQQSQEPASPSELHMMTINKLLTMLEDKEKRIKELEAELHELRLSVRRK